jgi:ribulose-5-phosphate 4-epimerase/fuculose-1-phosphate aldolase/nicotinamidase-related amidase
VVDGAAEREVEALWRSVREQGLGGRVGFGERPALLVVDMSCGFTDERSPLGADVSAAVGETTRLLAAARAAAVPIVFSTVSYDSQLVEAGVWPRKIPGQRVLVEGSRWVQIDPRLDRRPDETLLVKKYASCFFGTALAAQLTALRVDTLIVTGVTTSGCVRATVVDACSAGFRVVVPRQAVADRWGPSHVTSLFDMDMKYADVVGVEEALAYLGGHRAAGDPVPQPHEDEQEQLAARIALACRILHRHGHEHLCFGHVSGREPGEGRMLIKPAGSGLEEVGAADIVAVDLADGSSAPGAALPDELPLHQEIYRARLDVGGVVHTHPQAAVAASLHPERWAVACQDAVPFWNRIAFYEPAELVATAEGGRRLAAALGDRRAVLLRGHGLVAVGADVEEATVGAVLLERALRVQLAAHVLGPVEPIPDAELVALDARFEGRRRERVSLIWDYLARSAGRPA